tara:strand:+ start:132 stop:1157 length:1026 start_codon:yes stop_codon:yes gene_type:complete
MKKRHVGIPLFFIGVFALLFTQFPINPLTGQTLTIVEDSGTLDIHFCPRASCEQEMLQVMENAQETLYCAFYDLNLDSLKDVLTAKHRSGIDVKVVMDQVNARKFPVEHFPIQEDKSYGLMHNKFCIIDNNILFTGSTNPTNNGVNKNNNNLIFTESKVLISNYEDEFEELWSKRFREGKPVKNPVVNLDGIRVENYFCPEDNCEDHVVDVLKKAEKSIDFMTFSFTSNPIANVLMKHNDAGRNDLGKEIKLRGVMEARQVSEHSRYDALLFQEIDVVKDANKQSMHHKVFIVDKEVVITGSYNPTKGGNERNDENVLIIHDRNIAKMFTDEFERLYGEAT